uniref:DALR anticodon binding domain containing 3 n=1 Tax=Scleropages formosus TaxID=113540 RepID=A0A8C9TVF7_SCLFO
MEDSADLPFRISTTIRALSAALRADSDEPASSSDSERSSGEPNKLWFKESSARNLQNRDFLSPASVLSKLHAGGQVPPAVAEHVLSARGGGALPLAGVELTDEGLRVRVDRAAVFREVLRSLPPYLQPAGVAVGQGGLVLNCPALYPRQSRPAPLSPDTLTLGQLRTVLLADHQAALLRKQGFSVSFCPVLPEGDDIIRFLGSLGVDWPTGPEGSANDQREEAVWEALRWSPHREPEERRSDGAEENGERPGGGAGPVRINLREAVQQKSLQGYDPNLGVCTVQKDSVYQLVQLEAAVPIATVLHVTTSQDEFRQQQVDVLWRVGGAQVTQKHIVCGPVKTPGSQLSASQFRRYNFYSPQFPGQMWDDIIGVMTSATVRFELLSTVHSSPVTLDVQKEGGVSTKGPRGGVFVMYNCARLHTLFSSYEQAVEQGLYPEIPDVSQLDFSSLKEEGEWLLLFNYVIPFSELLDQLGQSPERGGGGARVSVRAEQICRFLVSLSKDFSSYYNRVHVLGEPMPHLYNQMFCRLQLLRALRELYHCALDTLHLPPVPQL